MEIIEKDLMAIKEGIIGHQTNCRGKMGRGIANTIRLTYPDVYQAYSRLCTKHHGNPAKLLGMIQPVQSWMGPMVYNLFGQDRYGLDKCYTNYEALKLIASKLEERDVTIHLPYKMGCNNAGGDWNVVQELFKNVKGYWCCID